MAGIDGWQSVKVPSGTKENIVAVRQPNGAGGRMKRLHKPTIIFMTNLHWSYFLALEADAIYASRYVEYSQKNYQTFSIEFAHLLMAAAQDVDVLLKQICAKHGNSSDNEAGYRSFFTSKFPKIGDAKISLPSHGLEFIPFKDWLKKPSTTPLWWTANNKVKHWRHTHFECANLENMLSALSALLVANVYFILECGDRNEYADGTKLFKVDKTFIAQSPAVGGAILQFRHP